MRREEYVMKEVEVWISSVKRDDSGMDKCMERQENVCFIKGRKNQGLPIRIDDKIRYQKMDGFGISITEGSAYLCEKVLPKDKKEELLKLLFSGGEGIGISMLRQPVGATDHCTEPYAFTGKTQESTEFDFSPEEEKILPTVLSALTYAEHEVKVLAAAWSAPAWMKTNESILGVDIDSCLPGMLREDMEDRYAKYLVDFIAEYEKRGIPIYGISLVNEADFANFSWPTMAMAPRQAARIASKALEPELRRRGLNAKIMCWDHNFDSFNYTDGQYVDEYYADDQAYKVTAGSAWHWYEGDCDTMSRIKRKYPDKEIWLTEGSGGEWGYRQWKDAFVYQSRSVIRICRNFAQSAIYWNMALADDGSPDYFYRVMEGEHSQNRGLVTIVRDTGELQLNTDYYTMGHFSKFVLPGAVRTESVSYDGEKINDVAFVNPDGTKVLNVSNESDTERIVSILWGEESFDYVLPPLSLTTFRWKGEVEGQSLPDLMYNTGSKADSFSAGKNISVQVCKTDGEAGIRLIHTGTPKEPDERNVTLRNETGQKATDITGYGYLAFEAKTLRYYDGFPVTVTFVDKFGQKCTLTTKEKAAYDRWETVFLPLEKLSGIKRNSLSEIRVSFRSKDRDIFQIKNFRFTAGYDILAGRM